MGGIAALLPSLATIGKIGTVAAAAGQTAGAINQGRQLLGPNVQNLATGAQNDPAAQQRAAQQQLLVTLMQQMQQPPRGQAVQMESRTQTPMPDIHALIAALSQRRV